MATRKVLVILVLAVAASALHAHPGMAIMQTCLTDA